MSTLQDSLYLVTLIIAGLTAILGFIVVNHLLKAKSKKIFDNKVVVVFSLLSIGYICFALGELAWYLLFEVFGEAPVVSMPDFYWVLGSGALLLAFTLFSVHIHQNHGDAKTGMLLLVVGAVLLGAVIYYINGVDVGSTEGSVFLGYYYPIASVLILIASISVYIFEDKINAFRGNLLLFLVANIAFLLGDLLYINYSVAGTFGVIGVVSEVLYMVAYFLCGYSFLWLLLRTQESI